VVRELRVISVTPVMPCSNASSGTNDANEILQSRKLLYSTKIAEKLDAAKPAERE